MKSDIIIYKQNQKKKLNHKSCDWAAKEEHKFKFRKC